MAQGNSCEFSHISLCAKKIVDLNEFIWIRNPPSVATWYKQTSVLCDEADECMKSLGKCPKHASKIMDVAIRCQNQRFLAQDDFIDCSILLKNFELTGGRNSCGHIPLPNHLDEVCSTSQQVEECESKHIAEVCGVEYVSVFKKYYDAQLSGTAC